MTSARVDNIYRLACISAGAAGASLLFQISENGATFDQRLLTSAIAFSIAVVSALNGRASRDNGPAGIAIHGYNVSATILTWLFANVVRGRLAWSATMLMMILALTAAFRDLVANARRIKRSA
jgi:hypothetical protein